MNHWDRMFKSAYMLYNDFEEIIGSEEEFQLPEGFTEAPDVCDGYGFYGYDPGGRLSLISVAKSDDRKEYRIFDGCRAILKDAFQGQPLLAKLFIPKSVEAIPSGALSNSGSWAEEEKGIADVEIDSRNRSFFTDEYGVYERLKDGRIKLLLYLEKDMKKMAVINKKTALIGEKAFYGRDIEKICFKENGYIYDLPAHKFFKEELLKQFGKNGRIYDFTEYDSFVQRNHYNAERIRMLCQRLEQPMDLTDETRKSLVMHIRENLSKTLKGLAEENAIFELKYMVKTGIFSKENISEAVEILNGTDKREMLTYLMDYKNEMFGNDEFDFSI